MKDLKRFAERNTLLASMRLEDEMIGTHLTADGMHKIKARVDRLLSKRLMDEGVHRDIWFETTIEGYHIKITCHNRDDSVTTELAMEAT